jgi:hypothetical protein
MLSKIEETRVKDFFNIMIRLNEKTEMEQSLLFIYSTYEGKDIEDLSLKALSKEDLKEKLTKLLSIAGKDFLTQRLYNEDLKPILHRLISKAVSEKIETLIKYTEVNKDNETSLSPLSVVLLFNNPGMYEIKDILLNNVNEDIKNNLYDNLIQKGNKWLNSVELLNKLTIDKQSALGLRALHKDFKSEMVYEKNVNRVKQSYNLNESFMIQDLLNYIDIKVKENKNYTVYNEDIFKNNVILQNIKDKNFVYNEKILTSLTINEIMEYLKKGSDPLYSNINGKNRYILPKIQGLLNIGEDNPLIISTLKNILLNSNEIVNIINYAEENKADCYSKESRIRETMDKNYTLLFSSIEKYYGKESLIKLIKDLNELNNKHYENIVDLTKIAKKDKDNYLFLNLLSNLYKETVNLLLNNGYEPHYLEKNAIMKGRKYKSIINKETLNKLTVDDKTTESIDKEIKILFGNITKSNLKNLDNLLKTRKEECLKYFKESAKELDNKVHYFYVDNKVPFEILSKASPVTSAILSGNIDIVNILLENEIPLTERQKALLYIPLSIIRKTIIDKEESENKILDFIKSQDETEELLINLIQGDSLQILRNGKWTNTTFKILNELFNKNYQKISEKNKVIILDNLGKNHSGKYGLLIYSQLTNEDKKIMLEFSGSENEDQFLDKTLSDSIVGVDIRGFLNSFFHEFKKVVLSEIDTNSDKADFYLNMLKSKDTKINFRNIDLLDGCIAEIEKTLIDDTFKNVQLELRNKNRL